jgi:2'-5' RNA ligase
MVVNPEFGGLTAGAKPMRIFFALELEEKTQKALRELARKAGEYGRGRWVREDNFHITLRFLGETPLPLIRRIEEQPLGEGLSAFPYRIGAIGRFRRDRGDILWAGVSEGAEQLAALKASLDTHLAGIGFPPEDRPYRPHITVARDMTWESGGYEGLKSYGLSIEETTKGITLMESRFTAEGVRYIPLKRWALSR